MELLFLFFFCCCCSCQLATCIYCCRMLASRCFFSPLAACISFAHCIRNTFSLLPVFVLFWWFVRSLTVRMSCERLWFVSLSPSLFFCCSIVISIVCMQSELLLLLLHKGRIPLANCENIRHIYIDIYQMERAHLQDIGRWEHNTTHTETHSQLLCAAHSVHSVCVAAADWSVLWMVFFCCLSATVCAFNSMQRVFGTTHKLCLSIFMNAAPIWPRPVILQTRGNMGVSEREWDTTVNNLAAFYTSPQTICRRNCNCQLVPLAFAVLNNICLPACLLLPCWLINTAPRGMRKRRSEKNHIPIHIISKIRIEWSASQPPSES